MVNYKKIFTLFSRCSLPFSLSCLILHSFFYFIFFLFCKGVVAVLRFYCQYICSVKLLVVALHFCSAMIALCNKQIQENKSKNVLLSKNRKIRGGKKPNHFVGNDFHLIFNLLFFSFTFSFANCAPFGSFLFYLFVFFFCFFG